MIFQCPHVTFPLRWFWQKSQSSQPFSATKLTRMMTGMKARVAPASHTSTLAGEEATRMISSQM